MWHLPYSTLTVYSNDTYNVRVISFLNCERQIINKALPPVFRSPVSLLVCRQIAIANEICVASFVIVDICSNVLHGQQNQCGMLQ